MAMKIRALPRRVWRPEIKDAALTDLTLGSGGSSWGAGQARSQAACTPFSKLDFIWTHLHRPGLDLRFVRRSS